MLHSTAYCQSVGPLTAEQTFPSTLIAERARQSGMNRPPLTSSTTPVMYDASWLGEEQHRVDRLPQLRHPVQRDRVEHLLALGVGHRVEHPLQPIGEEQARRDRVDAHALRPDLARQPLRQPQIAAFAAA